MKKIIAVLLTLIIAVAVTAAEKAHLRNPLLQNYKSRLLPRLGCRLKKLSTSAVK